MKIDEDNVFNCCFYIWILYLLYSIILAVYDFSCIKKMDWIQAENQTRVYSSRRSTTVTYSFEKKGIKISRAYPGLIEGLNTWLWGIDKKNRKEDISFFIRYKDFKKIENNQIKNRKDIFGNDLIEKESIPFFGLRKIDSDRNQFILFLDIWKYNYCWIAFLGVVVFPYIGLYALKKMKINITKNISTAKNDRIWKFAIILLFGITFFSLMI